MLSKEKLQIGAVQWNPRTALKMTHEGAIPERFETIVFGGFDLADAKILFEMVDDWDIVTRSIVFEAPEDNPSNRAFDFALQGLSLNEWRDHSIRALSYATNVDRGAVTQLYQDTYEGKIPLIDKNTGGHLKRPRMTNERLLRVASVYNSYPGGLKAVMADFQRSKAVASDYVAQARKAGLVEDRRRNKSN